MFETDSSFDKLFYPLILLGTSLDLEEFEAPFLLLRVAKLERPFKLLMLPSAASVRLPCYILVGVVLLFAPIANFLFYLVCLIIILFLFLHLLNFLIILGSEQ